MQTTYARNLIQVPKDAEYVVSSPTLIHVIGLAGLDFKLTEKNNFFTEKFKVLILVGQNILIKHVWNMEISCYKEY